MLARVCYLVQCKNFDQHKQNKLKKQQEKIPDVINTKIYKKKQEHTNN